MSLPINAYSKTISSSSSWESQALPYEKGRESKKGKKEARHKEKIDEEDASS